MEADWKLVYSTTEVYEAQIAVDLLECNNISAVMINKKDSAYPILGSVEVFVNDCDFEESEEILKELKA